jgi:hypothetical protein
VTPLMSRWLARELRLPPLGCNLQSAMSPPTSARQEILACVGQFAATALSTAPDDVRTKELARAVAFEMCHTLGHVDDGTGRIGSRTSDPSAATLLEWAGDLRQPSQMNAFKDYILNQPPAVLMICAMSS